MQFDQRTVVITGAAGHLGRVVALERFGRIDVLCNIAGAFRMGAPCTS